MVTTITPLQAAPAATGPARIPRCPRCSSRRWAVAERGPQLHGWCLACGLAAGDLLGAPDATRTPPVIPTGALPVSAPAVPVPTDRRAAGRPRPRREAAVRWIAHAGLAAHLPGGTPTHQSLDRAVALAVDVIELDVCATRDSKLVVRHDVRLTRRCRVADLTLAEMRARRPATLTLCEAVEQVGGRVPILIDLKQTTTTQPLARWLGRQRGIDGLAVCAASRAALEHLRGRAPRAARWQTLPALGTTAAAGSAHVVWNLAGHLIRGRPFYVGSELLRAGVIAVDSPQRAARHLVASPWRSLPGQLLRLTADTAPAGLCVDHRLLSPALLAAAAGRGLEVVAWTINSGDALRDAVGRGVQTVTTDDVVGMRLALAEPAPRRCG